MSQKTIQLLRCVDIVDRQCMDLGNMSIFPSVIIVVVRYQNLSYNMMILIGFRFHTTGIYKMKFWYSNKTKAHEKIFFHYILFNSNTWVLCCGGSVKVSKLSASWKRFILPYIPQDSGHIKDYASNISACDFLHSVWMQ